MAPIYHIHTQRAGTSLESVDWETVPAARIGTYSWPDNGYRPYAEAKLTFLPGVGFALRMACAETAPRAMYHDYNDPVYTDSCLEFFAAWADSTPTADGRFDTRYMNMEMNANGALLSCIGEGRGSRVPVLTAAGELPRVTADVRSDGWSVTALIPLELLERLYSLPAETFRSGYRFHGNFYKCGDETPQPHYGMWSPVLTATPDFHRPEFFGEFILE